MTARESAVLLPSVPRGTRTLAAALFCAVVTIVCYLPTLQNDFVNWDDNLYVYENPSIRHLDLNLIRAAFLGFHASGNWHPLTLLSHALDYAVWGMNPMGHHLTSVLLHGANTFLVVIVVMRLIEARRRRGGGLDEQGGLIAAVVTGLLFGIHPLHVESVAWISERKDVLYAMFYLLGILAYLRYAEERKEGGPWWRDRRYALVVVLYVLSLMSKPMAVTFPAVLLLVDWYPLRRFQEKGEFSEKLPLLALAALSIIVTIFAQRAGDAIATAQMLSASARIIGGIRSLVYYLYLMVFPSGLAPYYHHPLQEQFLSAAFLIPLAVAAGIAATCLAPWRGQRLFSAVFGYYAVALLPVLGIFQVGAQAMADRYTYLPGVGPFLLAGVGCAMLWKKASSGDGALLVLKPATAALGLTALIALLFGTARQTGVWKNSETLWNREVQVEPDGFIGYYNRGTCYLNAGRYMKAVEDLSIAAALKQGNTHSADAYVNRAVALKNLGRLAEAIDDLNTAMKIKPYLWQPYFVRGEIQALNGNCDEAVGDYDKAIMMAASAAPAEVYYFRGSCLFAQGRYPEALRDLTVAIQQGRAANPKFYYQRGVTYEKMGLMQEARRDFEHAQTILSGGKGKQR